MYICAVGFTLILFFIIVKRPLESLLCIVIVYSCVILYGGTRCFKSLDCEKRFCTLDIARFAHAPMIAPYVIKERLYFPSCRYTPSRFDVSAS
ncbi:hypothetical protein M378DRAFT_554368 [Amanita muscaria Koide BX008]|uniref:Uncharacterized protein n=1 Tax=Amanita muscaria (strain Koide BX008) TaxID=946122 RepID=A0A0C2X6S6_AMAMK|nr:hypothetical protein M378DRAFT_554368 [Amanita muscaria Koide BX008]